MPVFSHPGKENPAKELFQRRFLTATTVARCQCGPMASVFRSIPMPATVLDVQVQAVAGGKAGEQVLQHAD